MTKFLRLACLVLIGVVLVGCSQVATTPDEAPKPAPDVSGLDGEGRAMHLSEFRGKVVLLDFWFTDCPYCRQFEPQEKALKKRYEGRPFVVLGVNADPKREMLVATQEEAKLPWRSWWDGWGGPIAQQWGVRGFPTVVLIDHRGRIRDRWNGKPPASEVDAKVDLLVVEAEQPAPAEGN